MSDVIASDAPPKAKRSRAKRGLIGCGGTLAVFLGVTLVTAWVIDEPRPTGRSGPDADALARRVQAAVDVDAWRRTGAVAWTFAGSHRHLFDAEREYALVEWDDVRVVLRAYEGTGVVLDDGGEADHDALIDQAHAFFINDAFWLNPFPKLFDDSVTRSLVDTEGGPALLIEFASGGRTPGDAYLFELGLDDVPKAWRMWVGVIPVGGIRTTWSGWQRLSTGALVSTEHELGPVTLRLSDVRGANELSGLVEGDPFEALDR